MSGSRTKPTGLPIINEFAAGIDIGSRFHVVAVGSDLCDEPVQTFQAFTSDLLRMADWLTDVGIKTVAMESTGVYWVAAYEVLESRGINVILANAREARAVPGRKSDVNDAQVTAKAPCLWPIACQLSSRTRNCSASVVFALTRTTFGLCRFTYTAHAKSADLHEFAVTPCHKRYYRRDWYADYSCHCCG